MKVGDRVGPNWIITDGVKPGERVVVEGLLKMQQFAAQAPELARKGSQCSQAVRTPARGAGSN